MTKDATSSSSSFSRSRSPSQISNDDYSQSSVSSNSDFVKDAAQKLMKKEFDCILALSDDVPEELQNTLAEHLSAFCESMGYLEDIQDWVGKIAIETARVPEELFKGGFLSALMMHSIVNDRADHWFNLVFERILPHLSQTIFNDEQLVQATRAFVKIYEDSILDCPISIRQLWSQTYHLSILKWPNNNIKEYHRGRFLEVQKQRLFMTAANQGLDSTRSQNLSNIFSLLSSLSTTSILPSSSTVLEDFKKEGKNLMDQFYTSFLNEKDIEMCFAVVKASQHSRRPGLSKIFEARNIFDAFYKSSSISKNQISMSSDLPAGALNFTPPALIRNPSITLEKEKIKQKKKQEAQLEELKRKMESTTWKLDKEDGRMSSYYTHFDENNSRAIKLVFKVNSCLVEAARFFGTAFSHPKYNQAFEKMEVYETEPLQFKTMVWLKPPWPISKRQFCAERTVIPIPKEDAVYMLSVDQDFEPTKGYIKIETKVGGFKLETDKSDPKKTIISLVDDVNCKVPLPSWFLNSCRMDLKKRVAVMIKDCESNERDQILAKLLDSVVQEPFPTIYEKNNGKKQMNEQTKKRLSID